MRFEDRARTAVNIILDDPIHKFDAFLLGLARIREDSQGRETLLAWAEATTRALCRRARVVPDRHERDALIAAALAGEAGRETLVALLTRIIRRKKK